ncbi:transposase [Maribacter antarcticus]|uniref:transposase n=1 Tax=Maribacter antarcticus TaxID=505250 RepID=UPI00373FD270
MAFEYRNGACGSGYAKVIEDYSAKSLRAILDMHISTQAHILANGWTGYRPLVQDYSNLKQTRYEKCRNFPLLHNQIRNFKNWLRGVHTYCDAENMANYINEYFFRFNRWNHLKNRTLQTY